MMERLGGLAILALSGCGPCFYQQPVFVTDEAGRPIEEAEVRAETHSFSVGPHRTNSAGVAPLPSTGIAGTRWVSVQATGYQSEHVEMPRRLPLEITLRRETRIYEVIATLARRGPLSEAGSVLVTGDLDPRWFVEFEVKEVVRGTPPAVLRYAVHSPALFLAGEESGDVRIRGEILHEDGRYCHRVRLSRP